MDIIILVLITAFCLIVGLAALWMTYTSIKTIIYLIKEDMDIATIIGFVIMGCISAVVSSGMLYFGYKLVCQI